MFVLISHAGCCVKVAWYCSWLREQSLVLTLTSGDSVARSWHQGDIIPDVWWGLMAHDGYWPLHTLIPIANFHRAFDIRSHSEAYPNGRSWVRPGAGLGHIMANIRSGNIPHPGRGFMQQVAGNKNRVDRVKLPCNCYSKQRPVSRHPSCSQVTTPESRGWEPPWWITPSPRSHTKKIFYRSWLYSLKRDAGPNMLSVRKMKRMWLSLSSRPRNSLNNKEDGLCVFE